MSTVSPIFLIGHYQHKRNRNRDFKLSYYNTIPVFNYNANAKSKNERMPKNVRRFNETASIIDIISLPN